MTLFVRPSNIKTYLFFLLTVVSPATPVHIFDFPYEEADTPIKIALSSHGTVKNIIISWSCTADMSAQDTLGSRSLRLAGLVNVLQERSAKAFFLVKYFCGLQLASIRS